MESLRKKKDIEKRFILMYEKWKKYIKLEEQKQRQKRKLFNLLNKSKVK